MEYCNLELALSPPSSSHQRHHHHHHQQLASFNHGGILVADSTELQARAIIMRASRSRVEEERWSTCEMMRAESGSSSSQDHKAADTESEASLSMKRSLQRFLERRKQYRIQASAPPHNR